jgi:hypothetical protein
MALRFEIKAGNGALDYQGDIVVSDVGKLSYSEDQPEELSLELDTDFKRILELLEGFVAHYGSLEKFEIIETP